MKAVKIGIYDSTHGIEVCSDEAHCLEDVVEMSRKLTDHIGWFSVNKDGEVDDNRAAIAVDSFCLFIEDEQLGLNELLAEGSPLSAIERAYNLAT